MNNVHITDSNDLHQYEGSIWIWKKTDMCIFAQVAADQWCLIDLRDGNRIHPMSDDFDEITKDAILFAMSAEIQIEAKRC